MSQPTSITHTGITLSQAITVVDSDDEDERSTTSASNSEETSSEDESESQDESDEVRDLLANPDSSSPPRSRAPSVFLPDVAYARIPIRPMEAGDAPVWKRWYVVTKGRYVGVFRESFMATDAVEGISGALRERKPDLVTALHTFNSALRRNAVQVID